MPLKLVLEPAVIALAAVLLLESLGREGNFVDKGTGNCMADSASDLRRTLGPNSIEKFWLEFWLEKPLEFWLDIPYTKKMVTRLRPNSTCGRYGVWGHGKEAHWPILNMAHIPL